MITRILCIGGVVAGVMLSSAVPALAAETAASTVIVEQSGMAGGSVPLGAQRVPFLTIRLTASCGSDVPVHGITLRHRGRGRAEDVAGVYAWIDNRRVTRSAGVPQDGVVTLRFRGISIPACGSKEIQILGDVDREAQSGGEHSFVLEKAENVEADASVTLGISRPAVAAPRRVAGVTRGTIDVEYPNVLTPIRYGDRRVVARIALTPDGDRDHRLHAITFTNRGSARDANLQRLYLETSRGERLSESVATMEGKTVRIELTKPLLLRRRDRIVLQLRADVRSGSSRTVRFEVEEANDVEAD